jgi:sugar-specific transcriptional regulator TrmB
MPDLCAFGLSSYEDRAYRALLGLGPATAHEIAAESGVPKGRIYDALNGLESRDAVRSQTGSRPKRYVAVEPDTVVDRLLDARKEHLREEMTRYEREATELKTELASVSAVEGQFWTAEVGRQEATKLLYERAANATEQVLGVVSYVASDVERIQAGGMGLHRYLDHVDPDVDVRLLITERVVREVPDAVLENVATLLDSEDRLSVRLTDQTQVSFKLIDSDEVSIDVLDPFSSLERLGVVNIQDEAFASRLEREFEEAWTDADALPGE